MTKHQQRQVRQDPEEPNTFFVESDKPGTEPYRVDLEALGGNGRCGCMHFEMNLDKAREAVGSGIFLRCKHLDSAITYKALEAVARDSRRVE